MCYIRKDPSRASFLRIESVERFNSTSSTACQVNFFNRCFLLILRKKEAEIWRIVDIPPVVSSTEGKDLTITAKIAGPGNGPQPTVTWIKGKFSELKKSARLVLGIDQEKQETFLTIKKAKIFDEGKYTLKIKTGDQEVQTTIQVNVGKQEVTKPAAVT